MSDAEPAAAKRGSVRELRASFQAKAGSTTSLLSRKRSSSNQEDRGSASLPQPAPLLPGVAAKAPPSQPAPAVAAVPPPASPKPTSPPRKVTVTSVVKVAEPEPAAITTAAPRTSVTEIESQSERVESGSDAASSPPSDPWWDKVEPDLEQDLEILDSLEERKSSEFAGGEELRAELRSKELLAMAPKSWTPTGSSTTFVAIPTRVRQNSSDNAESGDQLATPRTASLRKFSADV